VIESASASRSVVTIRPYEPRDLDLVLALNNENVPALSELAAHDVPRLVDISDAALVAEVNGQFAGFCWVLGPGRDYASLNYAWFSERYSEFVYLDRIAVSSAFRRLGIGSRFYNELVQQFRADRPVLLCEVNVRPRNDVSLEFHERIGFREVGQQDTDGGKKTVSMLALALDAA